MSYQGKSKASEDMPATSPQADEASPDHEYNKLSVKPATLSTPYRPFPSVIEAYYQWNLSGLRTFHICGANKERLFAVKVHTGYSMKAPLGIRPGLLLYNGSNTNAALLAAAGDESQMAARPYGFNLNSVILLPLFEPGANSNSRGMVEEVMHARTTGDKGLAFRFSIEVRLGRKFQRELFECEKIKKGARDEEAKAGGFKLVRLLTSSQSSQPDDASSSQGTSSSTADMGREVVALFTWTKTLSNLKHPFSLQLMGDASSGKPGERWALMTVITALRLWYLHVNGKTSWGVVAAAEKLRGK